MVLTTAKEYVLRWNATLFRKELLRRGYGTLVSGGGIITPGTLVVSLASSPASPSVGSTVTLTATVSGGTTPYVSTWYPPAGITLSGTGLVRTFVAPTTNTTLTFRVSVTDSGSQIEEAITDVTVVGAVSAGAKFPGHVPNRVLIGMATPGALPDPGWVEARSIVGQPIYEARRFKGNWITQSSFNDMVDEADQASALPWISFKPSDVTPSGGAYASSTAKWASIRDGAWDADLISLFNMCDTYGGPVLCTFHHEPSGDGTLSVWAEMQEYCAWFFAGYRNVSFNAATSTFTKGTYNAANDLSLNNGGNLAWAPIGNGFWWRPTTPMLEANQAWPQSLINAINACKGVVGNDFYDTDYTNPDLSFTTRSARAPGTGVRTSKRITNFMVWARSKGVNAAGAGEYGVIDGPEMTACWQVMRANRDVWAIGNYFNSLANSDHDWRLVPATYPDSTYSSDKVNSTGQRFQDLGGDTQSAGRLAAYKTTLTESISALYTKPL